MLPAIPPSQPICNPRPNGHYQDSHDYEVHALSKKFCLAKGNKVVRGNQVRIGFEETSGLRRPGNNDRAYDNYDFKIPPVDGCPAPNGYDLAQPVKGATCESIMFDAWSKCKSLAASKEVIYPNIVSQRQQCWTRRLDNCRLLDLRYSPKVLVMTSSCFSFALKWLLLSTHIWYRSSIA